MSGASPAGLRRSRNPLLVSVRSGRARLHARHDGYGAQPRPERPDRGGAGEAVRRCRVFAGIPIAASSPCIPTSCSTSNITFRGHPRGAKERKAYTARHRGYRGRVGERSSFATRQGEARDWARFPAGSQRTIVGRHRRRVRIVDECARHQYRRLNEIPDELGHRRQRPGDGVRQYGRHSATGVAFTRNPSTGEKELLRRISDQRAGRRRGRRHPHAADITETARKAAGSNRASMEKAMPKAYGELARIYELLEKHYRDMQDIEFTDRDAASSGCCRRAPASARPRRRSGSRSKWRAKG